MKATFTFDLPEEQDEYDIVSHARDWYGVVWDMAEAFRQLRKYDEKKYTDEVDALSNKFWELINEKGLTL